MKKLYQCVLKEVCVCGWRKRVGRIEKEETKCKAIATTANSINIPAEQDGEL